MTTQRKVRKTISIIAIYAGISFWLGCTVEYISHKYFRDFDDYVEYHVEPFAEHFAMDAPLKFRSRRKSKKDARLKFSDILYCRAHDPAAIQPDRWLPEYEFIDELNSGGRMFTKESKSDVTWRWPEGKTRPKKPSLCIQFSEITVMPFPFVEHTETIVTATFTVGAELL